MGVDNIDNVTINVNQPPANQKNPLLAALGSFFVPGLGQVYTGQGYLKGLLYVIGMIIGSIVLVLPGLAIWIYGIYNAYKVAEKINLGQIPGKEVSLLNLILYVVLVFIIEFVIIFVIVMFSAVIMAFIISMTETSY